MSASSPAAARPPEPSVARRMADFITSHVASNGSVSQEDLLLDFTEGEIKAHLETAKQIARRNGKARH